MAAVGPSPVQEVQITAVPGEGLLDSSKDDALPRQRREADDFVIELQSGMEDPTAASGATAAAAGNGLHFPTQALFMNLP